MKENSTRYFNFFEKNLIEFEYKFLFTIPYKKEEEAVLRILAKILFSFSNQYSTNALKLNKMTELYAPNIHSYAVFNGNKATLCIAFECINPKYTLEKDNKLIEKIMEYIRTFYNSPLKERIFSKKNLATVKKSILQLNDEKLIKENVQMQIFEYIIDNYIYEPNQNILELEEYEFEDAVNKVTVAEIEKMYYKIFNESVVDVVTLSDKEYNINKYLPTPTGTREKYEFTMVTNFRYKESDILKLKGLTNGNVIVFVYGIEDSDKMDNIIYRMLINIIQANAYLEIREKRSLAYNIETSSYKQKDYFYISLLVQEKNVKETILVLRELEKYMHTLENSEGEIEELKKAYLDSLNKKLDGKSLANRVIENIYKDKIELADNKLIIEKLKNVTKEDLIKAMKHFKKLTEIICIGDD